MEKLIDDIIELILDDMDCRHEVDHDEGGTSLYVEYNLRNEAKLKEKIKGMIQKREKGEEEVIVAEWIRGDPYDKPVKEKAEGLCHFCEEICSQDDYCYGCGKFICEQCDRRSLESPSESHGVEEHKEG